MSIETSPAPEVAPTPHFAVDAPDPNAIHVLITGFGPFWRYEENPSWLAVKPLHNTVLYTEMVPQPPPEPQSGHPMHPFGPPHSLPPMPPPLPIEPTSSTGSDTEMQEDTTPRIQQIYITVLEIPVVYQSVMQITPGLHAKPPVLPPPIDPAFAPVHLPPNGFDFIFHVGVAGRGPLRLEKLAHKLGYRMKDAEGQYAPIVHVPKDVPKDPEQEVPDFMGKALLPPADLGLPPSGLPKGVVAGDDPHIGDDRPVETPEAQPVRGFGKPYESMPDELYTEIDVPRLILHLKEQGIQKPYSSMDAGHYLPDFLYYASLAEARRHATKQEKDKMRSTPPKMTPVLFMHCCPLGQPHKAEEVTDAIKKIVLWVCARLSI
ncbi:peptidase C15 pyroglutamyl peptidase I-like protein [Phanerochaete sordida]|uniref:Peptidase C15 pyroglutamyl peptidase I-like protein n=1 Tax=Phanerochaete sordida TaxID=48140 RepID=A0A9P3LHW5_9APHY|nr:peptidase C15 pyroglutamyl peptidase I-like protein [Phanerochaete sordida]